ncbi:MAG: hypothetical protein H0T50_08435 [Gemmatimonadales bacterium]|nr:hypothetical protein [Gemmatimonadales bacterium]
MPRNLSALAASILCGHLLEPAYEPPADVSPGMRQEPVRIGPPAPRLTDIASSQPHRP